MSLINEALKKAQERQNSSRSSNFAHINDNPVAQQGKQSNRTQTILIGIFILIALAIVMGATGLIVYGLKKSKNPTPLVDTADSKPTDSDFLDALAQSDIPESELERIAFSAPNHNTPAEKSKLPAVESTQTTPASLTPAPPVVETDTTSTEVGGSEIVSFSALKEKQLDTPPPEIIPEPVAPTPNQDIELYIQSLKVRGVMSGGSKVLIFDPALGTSIAYEVNSQLQSSLNITITAIDKHKIEFVDHAKYTYIKRF